MPSDWPHLMTGFAAHWNKGENFSAQFDRWFLNLFPREKPFVFNEGGYQTLSFIPTLGTMILGLLAGGVVRSERTARQKLTWLVTAGVAFLAAGWLLGALGLCPVVKRIWTPSFALFSGGWCFLFTALFYAVMDVRGHVRWAFPLTVLGTNSIAAYCMNWVLVAAGGRRPGAPPRPRARFSLSAPPSSGPWWAPPPSSSSGSSSAGCTAAGSSSASDGVRS